MGKNIQQYPTFVYFQMRKMHHFCELLQLRGDVSLRNAVSVLLLISSRDKISFIFFFMKTLNGLHVFFY